jgi:oxygen-independent coproporphyrinogen-3 oxidase
MSYRPTGVETEVKAAMTVSLYLHIPFCTTKCTYCAFNTYTHLEALIEPFVEALIREVRIVAAGCPGLELGTIFFGGGTPTLLTPAHFERILAAIQAHFALMPGAEITTEANPNDLDDAYLTALRGLGINRLSIGMQSAVPDELKLFARRHDHEVVLRVLPQARGAGFDNLNLDLIYGVPHQTLASWGQTLDATLALAPEHISLYALSLEDGTPMREWVAEGRLPAPDDDLAADMYDHATERLAGAGYEQYEISNWSKPGRVCRHNLQYWRNLPYIGVGPGAHGYAGGVRYATLLSPQRYIRALGETADTGPFDFPRTPATLDEVVVSREDEIAETLIMGLRLTQEGINRAQFRARFGADLLEIHAEVMRRYAATGLLEISDERVRLTSQGRLLSNMIFRELV